MYDYNILSRQVWSILYYAFFQSFSMQLRASNVKKYFNVIDLFHLVKQERDWNILYATYELVTYYQLPIAACSIGCMQNV